MGSPADIAEAWTRLAKGRVVFLARRDGEYLCEGPFERLDLGSTGSLPLADDDTEACIRLFFTRDECEEYCATWRELLGLGPMNQVVQPVAAVVQDVWKHLCSIVANSYADYHVPPRIDLCRLTPGSYPTVIDTLFSEREELH
jgi:hypothetical protein